MNLFRLLVLHICTLSNQAVIDNVDTRWNFSVWSPSTFDGSKMFASQNHKE